MSGEMHMDGRQDAKVRYSAAYPTVAERYEIGSQDFTRGLTPSYLSGKSGS